MIDNYRCSQADNRDDRRGERAFFLKNGHTGNLLLRENSKAPPKCSAEAHHHHTCSGEEQDTPWSSAKE